MTVVDNAMRSINKVLWESGLLTPEIQTNAAQLLSGCVPRQWENMWEGPEKPQVWLRSLALKKISLAQWSKQYGASGDIAGEKLNLSELFNPGTFLMALRQQTSREGNMRMDSLKLRSSFGTDLDNATIPVKLTGMLLQGSAFTGKRLEEADVDAAEVVSIQECTIAFDLVKEDERQLGGSFKIPIYFSTTRERLLTEVSVSVGNADPEDFVVNGSALFLGE
jgi:dynein heavy chain 2